MKLENQFIISALKEFKNGNEDKDIWNNIGCMDFQYIEEKSKKNKILPMIQYIAEKHGIKLLGEYKDINDNVSKIHIARLEECSELFKLLKKNNILYAVIKGSHLGQIAYGNHSWRSANDVDLLVSKKDIPQIAKICGDLGFKYGKYDKQNHKIIEYERKQILAFNLNTHQIATMLKLRNHESVGNIDITLDINFNLTWGGYNGKKIDMSSFLKNTINVSDENIQYKVLASEEYLLQLCLHLYKEANSLIYLVANEGLTLRAFCDIYYFIISLSSTMSTDKFVALIKKHELENYIYYTFFYIRNLFGQHYWIDSIINQIKADHEIVNTFGINDDEKKHWGCMNIEDRFFSDDIAKFLNETLTVEESMKIKTIQKEFY